MSAFLEGSQIYLRGISSQDASEHYLGWLHDAETTKGLASGRFPTTIDQLREYILNVVNNPNAVMFAICDAVTGNHLGNIKIDQFDWVSSTCELGLLIGDKKSWGKGVGTEACQLSISYAFEKLNMRKVSLTVYANNPNAIALYEKIGFKHEGRLKDHVYEGGTFHDKLWMSIFNPKSV
jgi:[ribosomal protein S5]-alanine N-acetyltransferase